MEDNHDWCPHFKIPEEAFWNGALPGFGQESYCFDIVFKYDEEKEGYSVRAFTEPSAYVEDEDEVPEPDPAEVRITLPEMGWDGLTRFVPSGTAVNRFLAKDRSLVEEILDGHDIEDGTLTEEALDAAVKLEAALFTVSENDESFWLIEDMQLKSAEATAATDEYDSSFWDPDEDDDEEQQDLGDYDIN